MYDLTNIDVEALRKAAKALNTATYMKDGEAVPFITGNKIKTVATTKESLFKAFVEAVEVHPEELLSDPPVETDEQKEKWQLVSDFYNDFVSNADPNAVQEGEKAPKTPKEKAAKAPKEKKEKPPKEKKPKKEKELSVFGHVVGSQAAALDDLLNEGKPISLEDLAKKSGRSALGVKSHIKHLRESRKLEISEKDGVYQLQKK